MRDDDQQPIQMDDPIRVAMILQSFLPRVGGMERQVAALAPELQSLGVEVTVVTRRHRGLNAFDRLGGVLVYRLPAPPPKAAASIVFTAAAVLLVGRLRPSIIHAHELFSPATAAVFAKRYYRLPAAVTLHRSGPPGDVRRLQQKFLGAPRMRYFRDHIDRFVAVSREIDDELAQMNVPRERRTIIPNGVDANCFAPASAAEKKGLRGSLSLPAGRLAVYAGRLAAEKRIGLLASLWPQVCAAHQDAHLIVLGSGPEEAALRRAAGENIHFVGGVENVAPYLQAADLFVLPSAAEGLSVAMLEAMAAGLPVIAANVGGAPEAIEHRRSGWLVPPDDAAALLHALIQLLGDDEQRAGLGREARRRVVERFALAASAKQLRDLYAALLSADP